MRTAADPEVNFFVELHVLCKEYQALPQAGGVMDQDSYLMYGLLGTIKAFQDKAQWDAEQQKAQAEIRAKR
jgi:hypothetical protein